MIALFVLLQFSVVFGSKEACEKALTASGMSLFDYISGNFTDITPGLQLFLSGKTVNDFGHYTSCLKQEDSNYVFLKLYDVPLMVIGLCLPKECTNEAVREMISSTDDQSPTFRAITNQAEVLDTSGYAIKPQVILVALLICFIWLLMLLGTALEYLEVKSSGKGVAVIKCFSVIRNWNILTGPSIAENTCILNGIRVCSMGWVILGHMYLAILMGPVINIEEIQDIIGWNSSMIAYGGYFAVDTFFWLGGFLMSYLTLKELQNKRGGGFWGMAALLRFLRLVPAYVFIILLYYWIFPYLGSGPLWSFTDQLQRDCASYWWTNILFLNNFIPHGDGSGCVAHAWYLAVDMQLFLLCLALIAVYHFFRPIVAWTTVLVLFVIEIIARTSISAENDFTLAMISSANIQNDIFHKLYSKPYCRAAPYLIGVMCAVVYFQFTNNLHTDRIAKAIEKFYTHYRFTGILSFLAGWGLFQGMLLLIRNCYRDKDNDYQGYSEGFNVFVLGIQTVYVAICYSLIFLPMLLGRMSLVRGILGWRGWSAAAKITYSTFLVHVAVMGTYLSITHTAFYWNNSETLRLFVLCAILSFIGGFFVYMMVEAPFGEIVKEFTKKKRKEEPKASQEGKEVLLADIAESPKAN